MSKPPITEDPESQPQKGRKRGRDQALPGMEENIDKEPKLTALAIEIAQKRSEWNEIGAELEKLNERAKTLLHDRGLTSYVSKKAGLTMKLKVGEETLSIKPFKVKEEDEEAA
jgi:hypothetical protein